MANTKSEVHDSLQRFALKVESTPSLKAAVLVIAGALVSLIVSLVQMISA